MPLMVTLFWNLGLGQKAITRNLAPMSSRMLIFHCSTMSTTWSFSILTTVTGALTGVPGTYHYSLEGSEPDPIWCEGHQAFQ
jgi:hypothetical protein